MLNAKLPELIIEISERLRSNIDDYWADVETDDETKNPLWELIQSFGNCQSGNETYYRLAWLGMFAAQRAIVCWELYCDTTEPHRAIDSIYDLLTGKGVSDTCKQFSKAAKPSYKGRYIKDCRECDTSCAAEAAANAAIFINSPNPVH